MVAAEVQVLILAYLLEQEDNKLEGVLAGKVGGMLADKAEVHETFVDTEDKDEPLPVEALIN